MIITKQKAIKEILGSLEDAKKVFLVGCAQCATVCKTGGEEELELLEKELKKHNVVVTGKSIIDPPCHLVKVKQSYQKNKEVISNSDAIIAMTCGDGAQSIADGTKGKSVISGLDSLFLGEVERGGHFAQKCVLCGECVINDTGGICPITICTKGLLNGPCGGSKNEKCEIDKDRECGWLLIYKRLKDKGQISKMKKVSKPQDYSKQLNPQRVVL